MAFLTRCCFEFSRALFAHTPDLLIHYTPYPDTHLPPRPRAPTVFFLTLIHPSLHPTQGLTLSHLFSSTSARPAPDHRYKPHL